MDIYIGRNIKQLRLKKNITQEKLAEHLNVSTQAVSKWERSDAYPDISMIMPLASYFGVSTDELLGFNESENEAKIKGYLAEHNRLLALGRRKEKFEVICKAYQDFPNDFRIIEKYIECLAYDPNHLEPPFGYELHREELYRLCDRVLSECTIDFVRYTALGVLWQVYEGEGKIEKAIETIQRFPQGNYFTQAEQMEQLYDSDDYQWFSCIQQNIQGLVGDLHVKIRKCALYTQQEPHVKICLLQKSIDLINLIYDKGDFGFENYSLCELYLWIAYEYIEVKDYEKALSYLDKGLSYGRAYDELPVVSKHTSFLVGRLTFNKMEIASGNPHNEITRQLNIINGRVEGCEISKMEEFKRIMDKYKPYAKEIKS